MDRLKLFKGQVIVSSSSSERRLVTAVGDEYYLYKSMDSQSSSWAYERLQRMDESLSNWSAEVASSDSEGNVLDSCFDALNKSLSILNRIKCRNSEQHIAEAAIKSIYNALRDIHNTKEGGGTDADKKAS